MKRIQCTDRVIMIRPANFMFNEETAESNPFQNDKGGLSQTDIKKLARIEFDNLVNELKSHQISVQVFDDTELPVKPDAIFPNNWFSTHQNNVLITYPMFSAVRRNERREDIIEDLIKGEKVKRYEFVIYEEQEQFLEGTGSMVLDRVNKIAYACISNRTNPQVLDKFAFLMGYDTCIFKARDANGVPIYHTNVMMMVGSNLAVVCLESVEDEFELLELQQKLNETGKELINISNDQMNAFAGNMIQLKNQTGQFKILMSRTAFESLNKEQIATLKQHGEFIIGQIDTIESYGGGSVRCMVAENFL